MAYEKVGGNRGPIFKWDAVGKTFEGFYMGQKPGKRFAGNSEPSRLLRMIPVSGGNEQFIAATGGLADDMSGVPIGVLTRIEYKGLARSQNGREFKQFDIQVDRTRTVQGGAPAQQAPLTPTGVADLEQALRRSKGDQVAGLMIDALKAKHPDAGAYESALREVTKAHGIA